MTTLMQRSFRIFHPVKHMWLRATPKEEVVSATTSKTKPSIANGTHAQKKSYYDLEIGLTERGLDDIGDMTLMRAMVPEQTTIRSGQDLLQVEWEGHKITSADELYHTVWETFSGMTPIVSPVAGIVEKLNVVPPSLCVDDDTVLVKMTATPEDWETAKREMIEEPEYLKMLCSITPGRFSEAEEE